MPHHDLAALAALLDTAKKCKAPSGAIYVLQSRHQIVRRIVRFRPQPVIWPERKNPPSGRSFLSQAARLRFTKTSPDKPAPRRPRVKGSGTVATETQMFRPSKSGTTEIPLCVAMFLVG